MGATSEPRVSRPQPPHPSIIQAVETTQRIKTLFTLQLHYNYTTIQAVETTQRIKTLFTEANVGRVGGEVGLDCDELMSVLKKLGARLTASQARALYRDADADGDGKVTLSEFSKVRDPQLHYKLHYNYTTIKVTLSEFSKVR